jgi:hypothetical protein
MSAREDRAPSWVRAVTRDPHIRRVYEDNISAAYRTFLAGRITESELDTLQHGLKQRAVRRLHERRAA